MNLHRRWRAAITISAFVLLLSENALAWGPKGHALVGQIADQLLVGTSAGEHVNSIRGATPADVNAVFWIWSNSFPHQVKVAGQVPRRAAAITIVNGR
jgi:hypothetical protein